MAEIKIIDNVDVKDASASEQGRIQDKVDTQLIKYICTISTVFDWDGSTSEEYLNE